MGPKEAKTHAEQREVNRHNHDRQHPGHERDQGAENRPNNTSAEAEGESQERDRTCDRMEDHNMGQAVHTVRYGPAEDGALKTQNQPSPLSRPCTTPQGNIPSIVAMTSAGLYPMLFG